MGVGILFLGQSFAFGQQSKEFAPRTVLQDQKQFLLVLEGGVDVHEEGVIHRGEDLPLHHHPFFLSFLLDVFLLHGLEGKELAGGLLADQHHLGVGPFAND